LNQDPTLGHYRDIKIPDFHKTFNILLNKKHYSNVAKQYKHFMSYITTSFKSKNLNFYDNFNNTPLHLASRFGYEGLVKKLYVSSLADPFLENSDNWTPIEIINNAKVKHQYEDILREKIEAPNDVHFSALKEKDQIKFLKYH
jgi:ankyrin repeat protein